MADRTFIIETILKARDDTARAFASALATEKAYNEALDERRKHSDALIESNGKLIRSNKEIEEWNNKVAQGQRKIAEAQAKYQSTTNELAETQARHREGDMESTMRLAKARGAQQRAEKALTAAITDRYEKGKITDLEATRRAAAQFRDEARRNAIYKEQSRILSDLETQTQKLSGARDVREIDRIQQSMRGLHGQMQNLKADSEDVDEAFKKAFDLAGVEQRTQAQSRHNSSMREYRRLIDDVVNAERKRDQILQQMKERGVEGEAYQAVEMKVDADVGEATARLEEFRLSERAKSLDLNIDVDKRRARLALDELRAEQKAKPIKLETSTGSGGGIVSSLENVQKSLAKSDDSVRGFSQRWRDAFGFAGVMLIAPVISALAGLVGVLTAVASAAVAAGGALVTLFGSVMAQGAPAVGLLFAAMMRLRAVLGLVSQEHQQQQQAFLASYQTAQQNAAGINQVANAQHAYQEALHGVTVAQWNYQNAVFGVTKSEQNLQTAQISLINTRREAKRQIEDLVMAERQAKLEFEQSSLSITDAQKALTNAIATGGDVEQAQLNLRNAQMGHEQAATQVSRAGQDANRALRQGVEGSQQVVAARRAVIDAERGIVDAKRQAAEAARAIQNAAYQAQQARAAITQARQQASGYNTAAQAQMAWLKSQMTQTELALSRSIKRIVDLVSGPQSPTRKLTDQILAPFIGINDRIYNILNNPKFFGAFLNLSKQMGAAITQIGNTLLSNEAVNGVIKLVNASAANMKPLATIVGDFFHFIGDAMVIAAPFVHQFLTWLSEIADRWVKWIDTTKGKNTLKDFFDVAFDSLKAFLELGASVARLIFDIVTAGGGARQGIDLLDDLRGKIDDVSRSIENHGKAWQVLQTLWTLIDPALHALGQVFGAIIKGLAQIAASGDARHMLQDIADLIAKYLVPALVDFVELMSSIVGWFTHFLDQHPLIAELVQTFITWGATFAVIGKGFKLIMGPLAGFVGLIITAVKWMRILQTLSAIRTFVGAAGAAGAGAAGAAGAAEGAAGGGLLSTLLGMGSAESGVGKWISRIKGPLLKGMRGVGIAAGGSLVTAIVGSLVGGDAGKWIDRIGTGGSIGAAMGSIFGPAGAVGGFIVGGLVSAIGNWVSDHAEKEGRQWAEKFVKGAEPYLPGRVPEEDKRKAAQQISTQHMLDQAANQARQFARQTQQHPEYARMGIDITGAPIGLATSQQAAAEKSRKAQFNMGWIYGNEFVKGMQSVKVKTPFLFIRDTLDYMKRMPSEARPEAAKVVLQYAQGLVDKKQLPKWAMQSLINDMTGTWKNVQDYLKQQGVQSDKSIAAGLRFTEARKKLKDYVKTWAEDYGDVSVLLKLKNNDIFGGAQQMWDDLKVLRDGSHGEERKAYQKQMDRLLEIMGVYWKRALNQTKVQMALQASEIASGTKGAADTATKNFDALATNVQAALKSGAMNSGQAAKIIGNALNAMLVAFGQDRIPLAGMNLKEIISWQDYWRTGKSGKTTSTTTAGGMPRHGGTFAGGGVVGMLGERGSDAVHAVLGRGEAVLNWAHQRFVEPALQKMYGWGLPDLFDRVRGKHGRESPGGFAAGGYTRTSWAQELLNRLGFQASKESIADLVAWEVMEGGNWNNAARYNPLNTTQDAPGAQSMNSVGVKAYRSWEQGFTATVQTLRNGFYNAILSALRQGAKLANFEATVNASPWGTVFSGRLGTPIADPGGSGAEAGPTFIPMPKIKFTGQGTMAKVLQGATDKMVDAANAYAQAQTAAASVTPGQGAMPPGTVIARGGKPAQIQAAMMKAASQIIGLPYIYGGGHGSFSAEGYDCSGAVSYILHAAGLLDTPLDTTGLKNWGEPGGGKYITVGVRGTSGSNAHTMMSFFGKFFESGGGGPEGQHNVHWDSGWDGYFPISRHPRGLARGGFAGDFGEVDPDILLRNTPGLASLAAFQEYAKKFRKKFAGGGFASGAVPIVAHVGEWVLNKAQQSKLAQAMQTSVGGVANFLGLTGGKTSFADGGIVGMADEFIRMVVSHMPKEPPKSWAQGVEIDKPVRPTSRRAPFPNIPLPTRTKGVFDQGLWVLDTVKWTQDAFTVFNRAQESLMQSSKNIRKWGKKTQDAIGKWIENYRRVSGQDGLFAQAATAIDDAAAHQSNITNLLAVGLQIITKHGRQVLKSVKPLTELQAAQRALTNSVQEGKDLVNLRNREATALADIEKQMRAFGDPSKLKGKRKEQYQKLLGERQDMMDRLDDTDAKIIRNREDQFENETNKFQAELDAKMRDSTQKLQKLRQGRGGLRIAQAFGLTDLISRPGGLNDQVTAQLIDQQKILEAKYKEAVRKHGGDPRWQKTIDDLLSQVQDAISAVAEAQAQALADRISKAEADHQRVTAHYDVLDRVAQVQAGYGDRLGAARMQIGTQGNRVAELAGFRQQYEQLLQEARATGNQGAILDLTAKLEDLDATMQEANLKTQQLITEYRKMSLDQLLGRGQREQGLFGAAKNIVTALNNLTGSQSTSALIKYVRQAGDALRNMATGIIGEVNQAMSDQSFGANQGQANQWLAAARDAFTQGPQAFADWLSANTQGLAAFEATLPDDQKALFQGLIDSMTDNTLATIDNSQQLKDLQGQQNQQDWSSSAWTMFREAIFNGMGGLLPQYAAAAAAAVSKAIANPELSIAIPTQDFITNVPSMDTGGFIKRSGLLYGHRGEMITPAAVVKTGGGNGQTTNIDVNITNPTEVADPVYLGNAIAWRLNHDPNSR